MVVSAALLRVFGQEVAELPLVATSKENQGKVSKDNQRSVISGFHLFLFLMSLLGISMLSPCLAISS